MKTRQIVCWLLCAASPALAQVSPWSSGTYAYDGAGNVKAIGADYYVYDQVGRLVKGSADKERTGADSYQAYTYDAFGNRLTASTTGTQCVNGCGVNVQVTNNRVTDHGAVYDAAGNLKQFDTNYYTYDGAGMLVTRSSSPSSADAEYIYTANDERLAIYTGGGNWRFTIRDLDAKVVREVTAYQSGGTTTWTWHRDHIFRDGLLLATVLPEGTQHYHLDHLGTPRLVTDGIGRKLGVHVYYPFGDELNLGLSEQLSPERLKYTGHERDDSSNGTSLDYMHARYAMGSAGRFLSVDPAIAVQRNVHQPQGWNRYAYALNNPMLRVDPDGRKDTVYFINTLPKKWWQPKVAAMLGPRLVGTAYSGHVQTIGPGASAGQVRAFLRNADSTDIVIIAGHTGQSNDAAHGGNMQMRGPNGQLQTVSGATLASWASDGSAPKAVIIAGCCSNQIAGTIHDASGSDALGTTKRTINTENQPGAVVAAGAIAQGMDANTAANMASQQLNTDAGCHDNPLCKETQDLKFVANPKP